MTGAMTVLAAKLLGLPLACACVLAPPLPSTAAPVAPTAVVGAHGGGHGRGHGGGHCGSVRSGRHCSAGPKHGSAPISDDEATATAVALVVIALAAAA